ncbi:hypothetical protein MKW98_018246 [Papaver atlanticum]|uniref:Uncharacterized protein n=1 Tax=Papaver atlanticum TaxID=357466 RepID=A0AAD4S679_9MAGN|nr:hypothetical protein MKW98_018246 [Papaver atlanticum]
MIELENVFVSAVEMDYTPKYMDCSVHMFSSSDNGYLGFYYNSREISLDAGSAKGPARSSKLTSRCTRGCLISYERMSILVELSVPVSKSGNTEFFTGLITLDDWWNFFC